MIKWREAGISALIFPMSAPAQLLDTHASLTGLYAITLIWNILDFPVAYLPVTTVNEDEQEYDMDTSP